MSQSVLLVEDNELIRRALALLLDRFGYAVTSAASLADGLASIDGQHVAIVDFMLPDGTGDTLLQEIRRRELPIRVALMSAGITAKIRDSINQLAPERFFKKPIDVDALINWISEVPKIGH
jgi:DNA-binding NtrC family response regulator